MKPNIITFNDSLHKCTSHALLVYKVQKSCTLLFSVSGKGRYTRSHFYLKPPYTTPHWSLITTIAYVIVLKHYTDICIGVHHSCPDLLLVVACLIHSSLIPTTQSGFCHCPELVITTHLGSDTLIFRHWCISIHFLHCIENDHRMHTRTICSTTALNYKNWPGCYAWWTLTPHSDIARKSQVFWN